MSSTRIFSTLFYPNALAGLLLLLLPTALAILSQSRKFTAAARAFLVVLFGLAALACLFWSGSKGGWLLMVLLGVVGILRTQIDTRYKYGLLIGLLVLSLTGFGLKYAGFFRKGATSVSARFDYWGAAMATAAVSPLLGTGPGTFAIPYAKIKKPESEMSRLVHNDYLEQASDSGIVGFLLYLIMIGGFLFKSYPSRSGGGGWTDFATWLGLLGFSSQGLMEFGLYIPALAWTAFALFGMLVGREAGRNASTNLARADTVLTK
jgi:O-antigen ligase